MAKKSRQWPCPCVGGCKKRDSTRFMLIGCWNAEIGCTGGSEMLCGKCGWYRQHCQCGFCDGYYERAENQALWDHLNKNLKNSRARMKPAPLILAAILIGSGGLMACNRKLLTALCQVCFIPHPINHPVSLPPVAGDTGGRVSEAA